MAIAVTGMHYTGMAALDVHLHLPPTLPATWPTSCPATGPPRSSARCWRDPPASCSSPPSCC
ncbi:membrane protein [Streptomyces badius]